MHRLRLIPPRLPPRLIQTIRPVTAVTLPSSFPSSSFPSSSFPSSSFPRSFASLSPPVKLGRPGFERQSRPTFLSSRAAVFDRLKEAHEARVAAQPRGPITVGLPDGSHTEGVAWETTPMDIARSVSSKLAKKAVVARITPSADADVSSSAAVVVADREEDTDPSSSSSSSSMLWDMTRPFEFSCSVEILTFESDDDAKHVFWHSAAHVLGQSLESEFGGQLCIGPATGNGFFYDVYMGDSAIRDEDYDTLRSHAAAICQRGRSQTFERLVVTKDEALELLGDNPFKVALIQSKIPDGGLTSVYRCGDLIDLCTGPHIPDTAMINAFEVLSNSSAYWLGDQANDSLQRVYAIAFPDKKLLKAHMKKLQLAKERDHRTLGQQLDLFFFHPLSPGAAFMQPAGTIVYNKLMKFILDQYRARGYQEVKTPLVYNSDLWHRSGHAEHYMDNMFTFDVEGCQHGLKPMNCPAHCLMFAHRGRSFRELPLRLADFGVLHRNELSGALTGLTRVRQFQQDDAHIFCTMDQVEEEVAGVLEFMDHTYSVLGFTYSLMLSTRPESSMGTDDQWDRAEAALVSALDTFGKPWKTNPGDGSFYGPKIDVQVHDALDRAHQCATIQLDFQLPQRFNLRYVESTGAEKEVGVEVGAEAEAEEAIGDGDDGGGDGDGDDSGRLPAGFARPVMIHRAILGSVERMMAMMLENTGGKWPFWLSPRQVCVVPVGEAFVPYAKSVADRLHAEGFDVQLDDSNKTLRKKIREAQLGRWNFAAVVGAEEEGAGTVNLRGRDGDDVGAVTVDAAVDLFRDLESRRV